MNIDLYHISYAGAAEDLDIEAVLQGWQTEETGEAPEAEIKYDATLSATAAAEFERRKFVRQFIGSFTGWGSSILTTPCTTPGAPLQYNPGNNRYESIIGVPRQASAEDAIACRSGCIEKCKCSLWQKPH
jgi:hypothetical protein